jgi:hypothetical protein
MIGKIGVVAGMLTLGALAAPQLSAAEPFAPAAGIRGTDANAVQQVQWRDSWRGRCRYQRRECAERYGWGSRRFYRCLRFNGCDGGY